MLLPDYPTLERGDDGTWQVRYLYWCAQASAESLVPAHGAACPLTGHTGLTLKTTKISPYEGVPERVYVELLYTDPGASGISIVPAAGTAIPESETTFFEEPIEDGGASMSSADKDTAIANNARTIRKCSVSYSYTQYKSSFTWSESAIIHDEETGTYLVGTLMIPTGTTGMTAGKWMFSGKSVRKINDSMYEIRETWTYDESGWNTLRPNAH